MDKFKKFCRDNNIPLIIMIIGVLLGTINWYLTIIAIFGIILARFVRTDKEKYDEKIKMEQEKEEKEREKLLRKENRNKKKRNKRK